MPVNMNVIEKFFLQTLNLGPSPFFDILGGFSFNIIYSAVQLKLFEKLNIKAMNAEELSVLLDCDERGLSMLLEVLKSLGYIKERKGKFYLTRMSKKWFLNSSNVNYAHGFEYYLPTMMDLWPHIAESLKKRQPNKNFYEWLGENSEVAVIYQEFMMSLASTTIPELINKISITGKNIIDIGGSHGLYSISLCRKFPDIKVTIIDSHYAMPLLEKNIREADLEDRISLITGDVTSFSFSEQYDTALLFNVVHEHTDEYNRNLIKSINEIVKPGGSLIILDGIREKKPSPVMNYALQVYGLLFYHFLGGQNYSFPEIKSWFIESGFQKVKRKNCLKSGFSLVTGYK